MEILKVEDIYYESNNMEILKGVSFVVKEGDCISIVGESGSGKSTLLKLCSDLISVTKGKMIYRDKEYKNYNPIEIRKNISYCVQTPCLFGDTVYDNLEFPFKVRGISFDKDKVISILNKMNLDKDYLEKRVVSLSGGEKQRIAFIRNILFKPDILLLDEVTSALDKNNTMLIEGVIKQLNESGVTVIWITHNKEQSERIFNKRLIISGGKTERMEVLK